MRHLLNRAAASLQWSYRLVCWKHRVKATLWKAQSSGYRSGGHTFSNSAKRWRVWSHSALCSIWASRVMSILPMLLAIDSMCLLE